MLLLASQLLQLQQILLMDSTYGGGLGTSWLV